MRPISNKLCIFIHSNRTVKQLYYCEYAKFIDSGVQSHACNIEWDLLKEICDSSTPNTSPQPFQTEWWHPFSGWMAPWSRHSLILDWVWCNRLQPCVIVDFIWSWNQGGSHLKCKSNAIFLKTCRHILWSTWISSVQNKRGISMLVF